MDQTMRQITVVVTAGTGLSLVFGAWIFMASYFAKHQDLLHVYTNLREADASMRIDWLEDRIEREQQKQNPDEIRITGWQSQIRRLETRTETLIKKRID